MEKVLKNQFDGGRYGFTYDTGLKVEELFDVLETYAKLYFIYVIESSLLVSNYSIREDFVLYDKALKVRRALRASLDGLFAKYDFILAPVCSKTEYKEADMKTVYEESYFTSLASMMGLPVVATAGVQLIGNTFGENVIFSGAKALEEGK